MSQIPGWSEAERDIRLADSWLKSLAASLGPASNDHAAPAQSELANAAATDGKFPMGLGIRTMDALRAAEAYKVERHQIEVFRKNSEARKREAVQEGGATALNYLNDVLDDFVQEVSELAPELAALPDLETIAETNDTAALALRKRRPELIEQYLSIRAAQESVSMIMLRSATDEDGGRSRVKRALLSVGQVRDAIDTEKHWADARKAAATANEATVPRDLAKWYADTPKPVLSAVDWGGPLPKTDVDGQIAALLNIVLNATPWVPSPDILESVLQESESATGVVWRYSDGLRKLASIAVLAKVAEPSPAGSRW